MLDSTAGRWLVGVIGALAVIALLAWARNDPGVGGRQPDPPSTVVIAVVPAPEPSTTDVPVPEPSTPDVPVPTTT